MTNETNVWTGVQSMLGEGFQVGDNCLYNDLANGYRLEVTGTCGSSYKRHFNIYLLQEGEIIGESTGVFQDDLAREVDNMCKLSGLQ
jgi:hypothetical protein